MAKENKKLLNMLKTKKISEEDYKILSNALDKKEFWLSQLFSFAINPFQKIAGWYSLIAGIIVILLMSYLGVVAKVYFTGLLGVLNSVIVKNPKIQLNFFLLLYQNLVIWLTLTVLYILFSKIFHQKRLRIIDFFGTVALSRFPFLILTGFLSIIQTVNPSFMGNIDFTKEHQFQPSIPMTVFLLVVLTCGIWQVITYFYALKESSGLIGKNLWISFIASLLLGEAVSSALTNIFF